MTSTMSTWRSNQLSYTPILNFDTLNIFCFFFFSSRIREKNHIFPTAKSHKTKYSRFLNLGE